MWDEVKFYSNQTGVLAFTDTIAGMSLPFPNFFILSDKNTRSFVFADGVSYLPLTPCNLPETDYNLTIGGQIDILFPIAEYLNWQQIQIMNGFNYMAGILIIRFWQL